MCGCDVWYDNDKHHEQNLNILQQTAMFFYYTHDDDIASHSLR